MISQDLFEPMAFIDFETEIYYKLQLTKTEGTKKIDIQLRDFAGNYCERKKFEILVKESYVEDPVQFKTQKFWTDNATVILSLDPKRFSSRLPEVFIKGQVLDDDNTFAWVPFNPEIPVVLNPVRGPRQISVQFRVPTGKLNSASEMTYEMTETFTKSIYLQPFATLSGSASPYTVRLLEKMDGLSTVTMTGCSEAYSSVKPVAALTCSATGTSISVTYEFSDKTSVTRSVPIVN